MSKKKNKSAFFRAERVLISVGEFEVDGEKVYNPVLTLLLDDFYPDNKNENIINISTDVFMNCPKKAVFEVISGLQNLFENIGASVSVYDSEMKEIIEFDLNEDFKDMFEEDDDDERPFMNQEQIVKKILH